MLTLWLPKITSLVFCLFVCLPFFFRCRNLTFPDRLPEVSIVFIFVNEALSVILRSIHSAIDRTPAHLLKEIILVDDNSNNGKRFWLSFVCFHTGWIANKNPWSLAPTHAISISEVFSVFSPFLISVVLGFVFKYTQGAMFKKRMYKYRILFLYV